MRNLILHLQSPFNIFRYINNKYFLKQHKKTIMISSLKNANLIIWLKFQYYIVIHF